MEEVGPTQEVEEVGPTQEVEEVGPTQEVEEVGPTQEVEETGPTQEVEEVGSTQEVEETGPTPEETGPTEEAEEEGPSPRTSPTMKESGRTTSLRGLYAIVKSQTTETTKATTATTTTATTTTAVTTTTITTTTAGMTTGTSWRRTESPRKSAKPSNIRQKFVHKRTNMPDETRPFPSIRKVAKAQRQDRLGHTFHPRKPKKCPCKNATKQNNWTGRTYD